MKKLNNFKKNSHKKNVKQNVFKNDNKHKKPSFGGGGGGGGNNKNKQNRPPTKKAVAAGEKEDLEIADLKLKYNELNSTIATTTIKTFNDFPLSHKTQVGLKQGGYKTPTDIQRESIGYALCGRDILGAAQTGSGKTLAFLIPTIEHLFVKKWSRMDGVGAIIISPTRELAYQIFETLRKIGSEHDFSAALIIGGKNLKFERSRMDQCNVVICTPGRLLQHMDENPLFNCSTMQILVLDEADRCLDMGFAQTMNAIIENLPTERQTLLFSATQTNSVKDLARLSLNNPVFVAPHEQSMHCTPSALQQNYIICNLEDKITMVWSFIKNHLKQKSIIFLTSCKQVKYMYEIFCKLRPGISLLALYGTLHQDRRMTIYSEFCRKSNVVLFATDIASRGLDFPVVNWVIQLDCPEDATAYIHRAGRTARHKANGENLLVLLPSEEAAMIQELTERKIPIEKIHIDTRKLFSPRAKMEGFLAQHQQLKETAQRAFVAYIKSVVLMKNKQCFNVEALDLDAYARSLGLIVTPRIRFLQRLRKKQGKPEMDYDENENENHDDDDDDDDDGKEMNKNKDTDDEDHTEDEDDTENNREILKKNAKEFSFNNMISEDDDDDDDGDDGTLIKIKRKDHDILEEELSSVPPIEEIVSKKKLKKPLTKAAIAKRILKKKIIVNKRVTYNEDGEEIINTSKQLQSELAKEYEQSMDGGINIEKAKELIREEDKFDKKRFQLLIKAKHKETKMKTKSKLNKDQDVFDEFGSDQNDDDNHVDLSWLPDPDTIYKKPMKNIDDYDDWSEYKGKVVNSDTESDDDDNNNSIPSKMSVSSVSNLSSDSDDYEESKIHKPPKTLIEQISSGRTVKNEN